MDQLKTLIKNLLSITCCTVLDYQLLEKMLKRYIKAVHLMIFVSILSPGVMFMQTSEEKLAMLLPENVNGWSRSADDEYFDNESLYNYINGGAELYLSYGFNIVMKRLYSSEGQPDITVDIFEMTNSYNAYGVYSHSRETVEEEFGQGSFQVEGAILFWKDNYFISIITFPETEESKQTIEEIARHIDNAIDSEGELPPILNSLPQNNLLPETVVYFRHGNWQNTYYFISNDNIFNINDSTECVLAKYTVDDKKPVVMILEYPGETEAVNTIDNLKRKFGYAELEEGLVIRIDDTKWFRMDRNNNLIYIVLNAQDTDIAKAVLKNTASQVQNYIEHK